MAPTLAELAAQEARLVFTRFDHETAWELGCALRAAAAGLPVAVAIRRNGQTWFHAALPGSSADNDAWLLRKAAVVERFGQASFHVGEQFRVKDRSFDVDARLDTATFAAHGGAFPLTVASAGVIGSVAVSGLPQADDHALVVRVLEEFLVARGDVPAVTTPG